MSGDLPKEIYVALLAAFASVVVAVIGVISSVRAIREQRKTQSETEALKNKITEEMERRKKKENIVKERLDIIKKAAFTLQKFRDLLQSIIDGRPKSLDMNDVSASLSNLYEEFEEQYRQIYAIDCGDHVDYMHSAKSILISAMRTVQRAISTSENLAHLETGSREEIIGARERIKVVQHQIRDKHLSLLQDYVTQ